MAGQRAGNPNGRRGERGRQATGSVMASQQGSWLNRIPSVNEIADSAAREIVGEAARTAGLVPGAARGAWHMGQDVVDGGIFLSRLMNPLDALTSPRGEAAYEQVIRAGKGVVDYARNAYSHPKMVVDDVEEGVRDFRKKIDPDATRPADTLWGEVARNFDIGLNRGEAAFDAASLLAGGTGVKALAKVGAISKGAGAASKVAAVSKEARAAAKAAAAALREAETAKYLARGYPEKVAKHFAEPYKDGMGSHLIPRRTKLPAFVGGRPVPRWIVDSPLFVLKPRGMTKGEFYERHFKVDPSYHGGPIREVYGGGGWSGRDLGWTRYGPVGRVWYGSPAPLKKTVAGAGMFGAGGVVDQVWNGERPR